MPSRALLAALCVLLGLLGPCLAQAPAPSLVGKWNVEDAAALLSFKASFENGNEVLSEWLNGTDYCAWNGIGCGRDGRAKIIELINVGLKGTIPSPEGWTLPARLEVFHVGVCPISGTIPEGLRLPATLESLSLSTTNIVGTLPALRLGERMAFLTIQVNKNLTGPLPANWALPPRLQILNLQDNGLTGTLPAYIQTLKSLQLLTIAGNHLSGSLPATMTFNTTYGFYGASLAGNNFSGTLPQWLSAPKAQAVVKPGNNYLCGKVPLTPLYGEQVESLVNPLMSLPACEVASASSTDPGRSKAAKIVAAVAGAAIGAAALAAGIAWWHKRRRGPRWKALASELDMLERAPLDKGNHPGGPTPASAAGTLLSRDPLLVSICARLAGATEAGGGSRSNGRGRNGSGSRVSGGGGGGSSSNGDNSRSGGGGNSRSGNSGSSGGSGQPSVGAERKSKVDTQAYVLPFSDLHFVRLIGRGSYGRVYLAEWNHTRCAAKMLLGDAAMEPDIHTATDAVLSIDNPFLGNLHQEASMLAALRHPNVVAFLGLCTQPPILVSEFCERGSVFDVLRKARGAPQLAAQLSWPLRLRMALDASRGMLYLHLSKPPVLHRDLKSPNLLLTSDWRVKVCDFNQSKAMGENSFGAQSSALGGNPRWQAPEIISGGRFSFASDVYAFGLVLWELMTFRLPFDQVEGIWQVVSAVQQGHRPDIPPPAQLPGNAAGFVGLEAYTQLMTQCWAQEPEERPTFEEVSCRLREMLQHESKPGALWSAGTGSSQASQLGDPPSRPPSSVVPGVDIQRAAALRRAPQAPSPFANAQAVRSPFEAMRGRGATSEQQPGSLQGAGPGPA